MRAYRVSSFFLRTYDMGLKWLHVVRRGDASDALYQFGVGSNDHRLVTRMICVFGRLIVRYVTLFRRLRGFGAYASSAQDR